MYPSGRQQKLISTFIGEAKPLFNGDFSTFPLAYTDGETLKWTIRSEAQRLRKWDGIAKDAVIWDGRAPEIVAVQVLDIVDEALYTISAADFDAQKEELITKSGGRQWMVKRKHWKREGLNGE